MFLVIFSLLLAHRVAVAFQTPVDSSDVLRQLAFTAHLSERGFQFYDAKPRDFSPEPWTGVWTNRAYLYPPGALLFFAAFSSLSLGIAWVKLALTLADAASSLLFRRYLSPWAALLFFASPASVFWGSHEGQFEPLQTLVLVLAAIATRNRRWFWSGLLFALAVQIKLFGVLLAPWILYRLVRESPPRLPAAARAAAGCLVGLAPFAGFYVATPDLLLRSVRVQAVADAFNPFHWNVFDRSRLDWMPSWLFTWMSLATSVILLTALAHFLYQGLRHRTWCFDSVPFISFWSILKTVKLTAFYYAVTGNAFLFCFLEKRRLVYALLTLQLLACPRSVLLLAGKPPFGHYESDGTRALMEQCMIRCDLRLPAGTSSGDPGALPRPR